MSNLKEAWIIEAKDSLGRWYYSGFYPRETRAEAEDVLKAFQENQAEEKVVRRISLYLRSEEEV